MKTMLTRSRLAAPWLFMFVAAVVCWPSLADAQSGTTKAKPKSTPAAKSQLFSPGIEIGKKVPAISLKNQDGETVSVQSMLQTGPVALVLFRSADW